MTKAKDLRLAPSLQLSDDIVTLTIAVLGNRGSGKTNTGVVITEDLLDLGYQVVVIDPLDVWWGLKSSADGKAAGYPVIVLGGPHGDVPLADTDGRVVADFVVDSRRPVIISLRHVSKAGQRRFMADFAEQIYRRKGEPGRNTPCLFVIDEASSYVPQRVGPDETRMLGALEDWVRRGRASGIGVTLIDQRAASVNKDVLTQIELLVAHRHTSPQDRKALQEWVRGHDTEGHEAAFMESLAALKQGEAWFWSPNWLDLFQRVQVRPRRTYDSSRTPERGQALPAPKAQAEVDLEALKAQLTRTIEQARENDPRELKAQIAKLQGELRKAAAAQPAPKVERVEVPVLDAGDVARMMAAAGRLDEAAAAIQRLVAAYQASAKELSELVRTAQARLEARPAAPRPQMPQRAGAAPSAPRVPTAAPRGRRRATCRGRSRPSSTPWPGWSQSASHRPAGRRWRCWPARRPTPAPTRTTWARCARPS
ncbi:MAG: DUF87 domain-containing protein [Anaerolineales bacterium]|nr:DUF87 domain-containing protein [Anaerolineales bacterium]